MKTTFRKAAALVALAPLVAAASCSSDPKDRGQIMIAISSDMSVPANLDEVAVEIVGDDGSRQLLTYPIQPNLAGKPMPGTVALIPPNAGGQRLRVRVIGQRNPNGVPIPRVLREALVVVPRDRVGLLSMPIRWLCDGELTANADGSAENACPDGQTCKAGLCENADYTAEELPAYEPAKVFGGGAEDGSGGECFDAPKCFDLGVTVAPDARCTLPMPQGVDGVSVGIVPRVREEGICRDKDTTGTCYIPVDRDDEDGWREENGRIVLPPAMCDPRKSIGGKVDHLVVTTACGTKTVGTPICGAWTNVEASAPVGKQTAPIPGASGGDADGGTIGPTDGGGGAGGASGADTGTCAGNSFPLMPSEAGGMFIVIDGSAAAAQTGAYVPTGVDAWLTAAATKTPTLGVGWGYALGACTDALAALSPMAPASQPGRPPVSEYGIGDFPLEQALVGARAEVEGWGARGPASRAIVVISAQGTSVCPASSYQTIVTDAQTAGITTHVISPGPGSAQLDQVAKFGGSPAGVQLVSDPAQLGAALDAIAASLGGACRFQLPGVDPTVGTVTLDTGGASGVLPYLGGGACTGADGYVMSPPSAGGPGYLEICGTPCSKYQSSPGSMVLVSTGCDLPPVGAGGTLGAGGTGIGGSAGSIGGAPFADAGPMVRCQPATCPPVPAGASRCCLSPDGPCGADFGSGCTTGGVSGKDAGVDPGLCDPNACPKPPSGAPCCLGAFGPCSVNVGFGCGIMGTGGTGGGGGAPPTDASAGMCSVAMCPTPPVGAPCCMSPTGPCGADTGSGCMPDCNPISCSMIGAQCGQIGDGCGNILDCGTCTAPAFCGGAGPNRCGTQPCTPKSCAQQGFDCGPADDGCGGILQCGTCVAPDVCGGGGLNRCGPGAAPADAGGGCPAAPMPASPCVGQGMICDYPAFLTTCTCIAGMWNCP